MKPEHRCYSRPCKGTKKFPFKVFKPRGMNLQEAQEAYDNFVIERKKLVKFVLRQYRVSNAKLEEDFVDASRTQLKELDLEIHKLVSLWPEVVRA